VTLTNTTIFLERHEQGENIQILKILVFDMIRYLRPLNFIWEYPPHLKGRSRGRSAIEKFKKIAQYLPMPRNIPEPGIFRNHMTFGVRWFFRSFRPKHE
jgi:hypothetical protein